MTIEVLTPIHQLLKHQQLLPDHLRQNCVLLKFAAPVPASLVCDFYRIHLTQELKQERLGEADFYRAELYQPSRTNSHARSCKTCQGRMAPATPQYWKCVNRTCRQHGRLVNCGPLRGVIDVKIQGDWMTTIDGRPHARACLLIMDRRYDEIVLAAVYRAAGMVCDLYGWRLL